MGTTFIVWYLTAGASIDITAMQLKYYIQKSLIELGLTDGEADLYFPKSDFSDQKRYADAGKCDYCGRGLSFSEPEEGLYKKMNVAMPKTCFNCRIQRLARPYSAVVMEKSKCNNCEKEVFKGKSARDFGRLHCEECYLKEVY